MRKTILFTIILLLVSVDILRGDFRDTIWKMTKDEVIRIENAKFIKEEDGNDIFYYLYYVTEVLGKRCEILYFFDNNLLAEAKYEFKNVDKEFAKRCVSMISKKYGEPTDSHYPDLNSKDYEAILSEVNRQDTNENRKSVALKMLKKYDSIYAEWETAPTIISAHTFEEYNSLIIEYASSEYLAGDEYGWIDNNF